MLKSLSYSEYSGDPRFWDLKNADFSQINLVVGKNSTGKSRLINVVSSLCKVLSSRSTSIYESGHFVAEIELGMDVYHVELECRSGEVFHESLHINNSERLTRDQGGKGRIYYQSKGEFIDFVSPKNVIALQQRKDELQHPFIMELSRWANGAQTYMFGGARQILVGLSKLQESITQDTALNEAENLVAAYSKAYDQHGDKFDEAIIKDMQSLGYPISEVHAGDMANYVRINAYEPMIGLFVREADRDAILTQMSMSAGMYRALDLIIRINIATFGQKRTMMLVDDIGEGLDYERATLLINLLIDRARDSGFQAVVTSNDRFIMNSVPLSYWTLLRREGACVFSHTERSDPKTFNDFKFLGLSNFDFFTSANFDKNE